MQKKREGSVLFRPTSEPSAMIPLGARSVGWSSVGYGDCFDVHPRPIVALHWGIEGTGAMEIHGAEHSIHPGQIGVYLPGMQQQIHPVSEEWTFRWWTMDGPFALSNTVGFGFSAGVFDVGPAPIHLFEKLEESIQDVSRRGEIAASAAAYELLCYAAAAIGSSAKKRFDKDKRVEFILEQIHKNWNNPQLNISMLAEKSGMHRSSLSRSFTEAMQISPSLYIKNLRIQNALTLLKETHKTIAEISLSCGYSDPNYFCRLMHSLFGAPPKEIRKLKT